MPEPVVAEIKQVLFHWPNAVEAPVGADHFGVQVQALIGPTGDDGADSFDALVCSPSWLVEQAAIGNWDLLSGGIYDGVSDELAPGEGTWLMARWSPDDLMTALGVVIEKSSQGPDWFVVAARIGRSIPWEYDYKYDDEVNRRHGLPSPWRT
jgi:hypothetical protein